MGSGKRRESRSVRSTAPAPGQSTIMTERRGPSIRQSGEQRAADGRRNERQRVGDRRLQRGIRSVEHEHRERYPRQLVAGDG